MYNSVPTNFISVPTKSYFFLPGGAGAPPGPLGKYAYVFFKFFILIKFPYFSWTICIEWLEMCGFIKLNV